MSGISLLKDKAREEVERRRQELVELSRRIHANPELGFQEHQAVAWLTEMLEAGGFWVERGLGGLPTAFRATWGGERPAVAILAEYDALPGVGHGCGHNIIAASAVGAALAAAAGLGDRPGTLFVIGTPAEESGGGKVALIKAGVFADLDAVMLVHPGIRNAVLTETLACAGLEVEFFGRAAHAAAEPEKGINALDALVLAFNGTNALRQHIRGDARIHGIITRGGDAPNIIPAHTAASLYVRARDNDYLEELGERVLQCFRGAAKATGAGMEHKWSEWRYAAMVNNLPLAEAFAANLEALGRAVQAPDPAEGFGSTDMGNVSVVGPSIHASVAIAPAGTLRHSPAFAAAAISPQGEQGLLDAAKALAMTAIDVLTEAKLRQRIRAAFQDGNHA